MARAGSTPIALGALGVGSLFILSGIQGKSLQEILHGEFGPTPPASFGQKQGGGFAGSNTLAEALGHGGPTTGSTGAEGSPTAASLTPVHSAASGGAAPSPVAVGQAVKKNSAFVRRGEELKYGVTIALHYKEELERQVGAKQISQKQGEQMFAQKYPWYATWVHELKAYIG